MTVNDSKSYFPYLNKLDQYNNTYNHSINKKPINADYSVSTENIESNPKAPKLLSIRIFLVKVILKIGQQKYLLLILF